MSAASDVEAGSVGAGVGESTEVGAGGVEGLVVAGTLAGGTGGEITGVGALVVTAAVAIGDSTGVATAAFGDFTGRPCGEGDFRPFGVFFAGALDRSGAFFLRDGFGAARFAEVLFTGERPLAAFVFLGAGF